MDPMSSEAPHPVPSQVMTPRRFRLPSWLLLLLFVAVAFPVRNTAWFTSPHHQEMGDLAANMLQVREAQAGRELLGPYSRFGFHHLGPISFYVQALGNGVFDVLPAPLARAHLAQFLANQVLLALMAFLASRDGRHEGWATGLVFVGLTAMALGHGTSLLGWCSIWGPRLVVSAVLLCVVASARCATGDVSALPCAVIGATFALHNHLLTAAVCLPVLAVAVVRLVLLRRFESRWAWIAVGLTVLAIAPAVAEELREEPGNLELLWNFSRESPLASHGWDEAGRVVVAGIAKWVTIPISLAGRPVDPFAGWIQILAAFAATAGAGLAFRDGSNFVRWAVLFSWGGLLVSIGAARAVEGPLLPYLFTYLFALVAILVASVIVVLVRRSSLVVRPWARLALGLAAGGMLSGLMLVRPLPLPAAHSDVDPVVAAIVERAPCHAVTLRLEHSSVHHVLWRQQAGLVLELRRRGYWVSTDETWSFMIPSEPAPAPCSQPLQVHLHVDDASTPEGETLRSGILRATFTRRFSE